MSNTTSSSDAPPPDDGWIEVGQPPAPQYLTGPTPDDEHKPFESRKPAPPWKYSVFTGGTGVIFMLALYIFPDLRRIDTPWDDAFPAVYAMLVFPILAFIWGVIGLLGKQFRPDAARAALGILLSLIGFGLAYAAIAADRASDAQQAPTAADERLEMTPQELQEWRSNKLRQR